MDVRTIVLNHLAKDSTEAMETILLLEKKLGDKDLCMLIKHLYDAYMERQRRYAEWVEEFSNGYEKINATKTNLRYTSGVITEEQPLPAIPEFL